MKSIYSTKRNDKQSIKTLDVDGVKIRDLNLIADAFCSFFTSIVTSLKEKAFPLCNFSWKRPTKILMKTDQKFIFVVVLEKDALFKGVNDNARVNTNSIT